MNFLQCNNIGGFKWYLRKRTPHTASFITESHEKDSDVHALRYCTNMEPNKWNVLNYFQSDIIVDICLNDTGKRDAKDKQRAHRWLYSYSIERLKNILCCL